MTWASLWEAVFVVAAVSSGVITVLIAIRGGAEIRELFAMLKQDDRPRP
jgi:hypothetical protein